MFLPFSPRGEKSIFVYFGAIVRSALDFLKIPNDLSLPILNLISITIILFVLCKIFKVDNVRGASISCIFFLTFHDTWQLAVDGYHTVFGFAFTITGLLYIIRQRLGIASIIFSLAIFSSPHQIIPIVSILISYIVYLQLTHTPKHLVISNVAKLIFGFSIFAITSELIHLLQPSLGGLRMSPISSLLFEREHASIWGGRAPFYIDFAFEYMHAELGSILFLILCFGFIYSFIAYDKNILITYMPLMAIFSMLLTTFSGLPQIGRAYYPSCMLIIVASSLGIAHFATAQGGGDSSRSDLLLVALLAIFGFSVSEKVLPKERDNLIVNSSIDRIVSTVSNKTIVPATAIDLNSGNISSQLLGNIIKVDIRYQAKHHDYYDKSFENIVYKFINEEATIASYIQKWDRYRCFENEFQHSAFCRGDWFLAYPEYVALQKVFEPNIVYYLSGDQIYKTIYNNGYKK